MAQWRAVVMFPRLVELEFAKDVPTAFQSVTTIINTHKTIKVEEQEFTPRLAALLGPKEVMQAYQREMAEKHPELAQIVKEATETAEADMATKTETPPDGNDAA